MSGGRLDTPPTSMFSYVPVTSILGSWHSHWSSQDGTWHLFQTLNSRTRCSPSKRQQMVLAKRVKGNIPHSYEVISSIDLKHSIPNHWPWMSKSAKSGRQPATQMEKVALGLDDLLAFQLHPWISLYTNPKDLPKRQKLNIMSNMFWRFNHTITVLGCTWGLGLRL